MIVGVIGGGTVGKATARAFMEHCEVRVYDTDKKKATHSADDTLAAGVVFVCLPTPQLLDGSCDLTFLHEFFQTQYSSSTCFALRSTVPVGTTVALRRQYQLVNLVHSPEFLTARCAATDAMLPARNIVGGPYCVARVALSRLYALRYPHVPLHVLSSDESECVKLICNAFFAVKVAFFNEAYTLAQAKGLDWKKVLAAVLADGRISPFHTNVPGPDNSYGFGGTCLPKDTANFAVCLEEASLDATMARAALERNKKDRLR